MNVTVFQEDTPGRNFLSFRNVCLYKLLKTATCGRWLGGRRILRSERRYTRLSPVGRISVFLDTDPGPCLQVLLGGPDKDGDRELRGTRHCDLPALVGRVDAMCEALIGWKNKNPKP